MSQYAHSHPWGQPELAVGGRRRCPRQGGAMSTRRGTWHGAPRVAHKKHRGLARKEKVPARKIKCHDIPMAHGQVALFGVSAPHWWLAAARRRGCCCCSRNSGWLEQRLPSSSVAGPERPPESPPKPLYHVVVKEISDFFYAVLRLALLLARFSLSSSGRSTSRDQARPPHLEGAGGGRERRHHFTTQ